MSPDSPETRIVETEQGGVISHAQALTAGIAVGVIRSRLRRNEWQRLHRGIYATFSGPVPRATIIWGVLLTAGKGAVLSHYTAAEIAGLSAAPRSTVHVTVPSHRRVSPIRGAAIHISRHVEARRHPTRRPAQTRIEETILDLADLSPTPDEAIGWLSSACGQRLTTPQRISDALTERPRSRWRPELASALREVAGGTHSLLEFRYRVGVELGHGLPAGTRQVRRLRSGGSIYDDVHYADYGVTVELDGRVAHPYQMAFRDLKRDIIAAARGDVVLHFGWTDVTTRPCEVAIQVEDLLRQRGWRNTAGSCGPKCMISKI